MPTGSSSCSAHWMRVSLRAAGEADQLARGDPIRYELVSVVREFGVAHTQRPIPVVRHAVITEAVDMELGQPIVVEGQEEGADQFAGVVDARALVCEEILGEGTHERVRVIAESIVEILIGEQAPACVAIHGVDDHGDPAGMGLGDKLL